jgi:hypothetical protein
MWQADRWGGRLPHVQLAFWLQPHQVLLGAVPLLSQLEQHLLRLAAAAADA